VSTSPQTEKEEEAFPRSRRRGGGRFAGVFAVGSELLWNCPTSAEIRRQQETFSRKQPRFDDDADVQSTAARCGAASHVDAAAERARSSGKGEAGRQR